jgi:copper chaperone CopZ
MHRCGMFVLVGVLGCGVAITGCRPGDETESVAQLASATIELPVYGMDCDGCVAAVRRMIERVPGVVSCDVDLDGQVAHIGVTDEADRAMLVRAVKEAGFSTDPSHGDGAGHGHDHDHDHDHDRDY